MPINNSLGSKSFPFEIMFDVSPTTKFYNNLHNIEVQLVQSQSYDEIKQSFIDFANATWVDQVVVKSGVKGLKDTKLSDKFMYHIFTKRILPSTMETLRLTFFIDGISIQEATHILRYRKATFSAECSGDKFLNDKNFVVPTAIQNSEEFLARYKDICLQAKRLYCDMVQTRKIATHDARYILPRSLETYYYMSISLKDVLMFIYDRVDKQIQPQSDNVIAYYMMLEICKRYPLFSFILDENYIHRPADFYIKTARQSRSTNWYCPDADSDLFEYTENDFVYKMTKRDDLLGTNETATNQFQTIQNEVKRKIKLISDSVIESGLTKDYLESDFTADELAIIFQ